MECKVVSLSDFMDPSSVLIETLWNVKTGTRKNGVAGRGVLIETLWNVKMGESVNPDGTLSVLIETLWNVKKEEAAPIEYTAGINRNIVECKVLCPAV